MKLSPLDEFPIHQTSRPIGTPASSDRNFYDRSYFNVLHRDGDFMVVTGIGYYPRLGVKDAFVAIRRGDEQTVLRLSDAIDDDRLTPHVNGYQVQVVDPLRQLRITLEQTEGIGLDLTWNACFPAALERPHVMTTGNQVALDACRFAQLGTWSGRIDLDGIAITVDPETCVSSRDRSWGIRPIGEPGAPGRPADPAFQGIWWLYAPIAFDDYVILLILQEDANGARSIYDCTRRHRDGTVEQLDGVRVAVDYVRGTRIPRGARIDMMTRAGETLRLDVESKLFIPFALGTGYNGDPTWAHGTWKGESFAERVSFDLTDDAVRAQTTFSVIDHVAVATCTRGDGTSDRGSGLFEHGLLGLHYPSGFTDWTSGAA